MIKKITLYSLFLYIGFVSMSILFLDKNIEDTMFLSIFFLIGASFLAFIISMLQSQKIEIKIIDYMYGSNGMPNMTPVGRGRKYTFTYVFDSVECTKTLSYGSQTPYNIGDTAIAFKNKNIIVLKGDLMKLIFFAIFPMIMSIIFVVV